MKLLSVGYIQYNFPTSVAPENASVVFKRIRVTNLCWCGGSEVLLFFAVWFWLILGLSIERSWEGSLFFAMVGEGKPCLAFNSAYNVVFPSLSPDSVKATQFRQDLRNAELRSLPQMPAYPLREFHNASDECHWWTCLQAATETETENRLADTMGERKGGMSWESGRETYLLPVWHRELRLVLCGNLEGRGVVGGGRGAQEEGDISTSVADSCWCMAETNTIS